MHISFSEELVWRKQRVLNLSALFLAHSCCKRLIEVNMFMSKAAKAFYCLTTTHAWNNTSDIAACSSFDYKRITVPWHYIKRCHVLSWQRPTSERDEIPDVIVFMTLRVVNWTSPKQRMSYLTRFLPAELTYSCSNYDRPTMEWSSGFSRRQSYCFCIQRRRCTNIALRLQQTNIDDNLSFYLLRFAL